MKFPKEREYIPTPNFEQIKKQLNSHGLETPETIRLRDEIKKFFESHKQEIEQVIGTSQFSVMVGGSLQAGTADSHSDIDLTIIINTGNTGQIWLYGGSGETTDGIRGIFLFRSDSLKQQTQRDIDINLLSVENSIEQLESLESLESKDNRLWVIDEIIRIFLPQLYGADDIIYDFRKSIIQKLNEIPNGKEIWNNEITPQFKEQLIQRISDEKGESWPERDGRSKSESQKKNALSKEISERLSILQIPNFQEIKTLYGI